MQHEQQQHYYLFVNTVSGGGLGKSYLTVQNKKITFDTEKSRANVYLYDIIVKQQLEKGLHQLKQQAQKCEVYLVICGGDGTVLSILTETLSQNINMENVTFTVIPIGTGNDFSRTLGWGHKPIQFSRDNLHNLFELIKKWQKAEHKKYDLWDVNISTYDNGRVLKVKDYNQNNQGSRQLNVTFANYFGVGIDGRVVFTSEKNRTQNKAFNRFIYGIVGCFCCFNPAPAISEIVERFVNHDLTENLTTTENDSIDMSSSTLDIRKKQMKPIALLKDTQEIDVKLKKYWHCLVCINGKNFMGGVSDIWKPKKNTESSQEFDDGKLEMIAFRNQLSLCIQRTFRINVADTVVQSSGPLQLQFKQSDKQILTYVQIDGQPRILINPKKITIRQSALAENGKINVLANTQI